jgi:hypothetical protein
MSSVFERFRSSSNTSYPLLVIFLTNPKPNNLQFNDLVIKSLFPVANEAPSKHVDQAAWCMDVKTSGHKVDCGEEDSTLWR